MAAPLSKAEIDRRVEAIHDALRAGHKPETAPKVAALALGMSSNSLRNWLADQVERGAVKIDWSQYRGAVPPRPAIDPPEPRPAGPSAPAQRPGVIIEESLVGALRKGPLSLDVIAARFGVTKGQALDAIDEMKARGVNIMQAGSLWSIAQAPEPAFVAGATFEYVSRPDNTFLFGATSDNHLGSKYERLDVLNDLYDRFERAGVDRVFNAGNWIDGVGGFRGHEHDLKVHGMEPQLAYLVDHYPSRDGIKTYSVTGEDHEGWMARREGIDIGRRAQQTMRDAGREDWIDIGFMEAHFRLVNANTGKSSILAVVHPGGGSAYALSYSVQKIIEALEGGEKPAVALYGHYHKLWAGIIRNVWVMQTGCTQDQTVFTRNKIKQEVHVGGGIVELEQDPASGAIIGFTPKLIRYFAKNYYSNLPLNRWSKSGPVTLPERAP